MILIAIKELHKTNQVDQAINKYFEKKDIPSYKFINKFEKFNSWTPLLIDPRDYDLEEELIEFLSKELSLEVFGYEYQDTVTAYLIYLYKCGECMDEFTYIDYEIISTYGFFAYLDDLPDNEKVDLETNEVLKAYYDQLGFDPIYVSFEDQY